MPLAESIAKLSSYDLPASKRPAGFFVKISYREIIMYYASIVRSSRLILPNREKYLSKAGHARRAETGAMSDMRPKA
jgi:hypothetical protein